MSSRKHWKEVTDAAGDNAKRFVGLKRTNHGRVKSQSGSDQPEEQAQKHVVDPAKKGRRLITQNMREVRGNANTYESHIGAGQESAVANSDVLPETEIVSPSTPQLLMGEAVNHLQGRQCEVYLLTMREGRSLAEAAEILDISKGTAQVYRDRAVKFIENYCKEAIARGRV